MGFGAGVYDTDNIILANENQYFRLKFRILSSVLNLILKDIREGLNQLIFNQTGSFVLLFNFDLYLVYVLESFINLRVAKNYKVKICWIL